MITDVDGVRAGHWTDEAGMTGCTVVLLPGSSVASGEVRGGAPGTREFALLEPGRLVQHVDAIVLTGGSAFGLAACDGVVRWCEERDIGFPTSAGVVPIVVGMVLFDLSVGDASARPTAESGYAACEAATTGTLALGRVGAGTGATYAKWQGREHAKPAGIGSATERVTTDGADLVVSALVAVNAVGDLRPHDRSVIWNVAESATFQMTKPSGEFEATTIGAVVTNAKLDKLACNLVAQSAHDGLARALEPAHTAADGDAFVAAATGVVEAPTELVRLLAARAVERAIEGAVSAAPS